MDYKWQMFFNQLLCRGDPKISLILFRYLVINPPSSQKAQLHPEPKKG